MKLNPPGALAATTCSFANWFLAILFAAFLPIIFASTAADSQTGGKELTPTEQWVVAQLTAGEIADLSTHAEKDRKLSADFLQDLIMAELPGLKTHRNGLRIIGAIIDEPIDVRNAQIRGDVRLEQCHFNKTVTFVNANFLGNLSFNRSWFEGEADFMGMKVGGDALFNATTFDGPAVRFKRVNVVNDFRAFAAKFRNKQHGAFFDRMKVGGAAYFEGASFEGHATFFRADIAGKFTAANATFGNEQMEAQHGFEADFRSMKVGVDADFSGALFEGQASFARADIAGDFNAFKARFQNEQLAGFLRMKVGGSAVFNRASFKGQAGFAEADIASNFNASGAMFQNQAIFLKLKVGGRAFFAGTRFEGPVDFSFADISWLDLSGASWPKLSGQVHLQGMNYNYIRAGKENENEPKSHKEKERKSHEALLELAEQSSYTADVYTNLESFFLRQGYRADADKAFIAGKSRERQKYFDNGDWLHWLGSLTLYLLVGYGRRSWQAAILCAILVALGCVFFAPDKMEPQNPGDTPRVYSRFWYSLGLFLPFVDLQSNKVWKPKADQTRLRHYMRVHILLGWILIPIVLAALTGILK
jgi:hypothetical protein